MTVASTCAAIACQSASPAAVGWQPHCIAEADWPTISAVDRARVASCDPLSPDARCAREDYLEATCYAVEAYRRELTRQRRGERLLP